MDGRLRPSSRVEGVSGGTRSACGAWVEMMCVWATGTRGRVAYLGFEKVMQTIHIMHAERSVGNCCEPERSCNTSTLTSQMILLSLCHSLSNLLLQHLFVLFPSRKLPCRADIQ